MVKINLRSSTSIFIFFILISIALRFYSFFPAVLDHDESTYLIIGRDILHGKNLYTDVTDTKPVGVFIFYAFLQFLFGNSIFLKRMFFAVIVGITAFFIQRISFKMFRNAAVALASGIIYILYVSIWVYHGLSPNTELLFNLTTSLALLFFMRHQIGAFAIGGLLMGIGFMIKYLVLFDFTAFLLFFFIYEMRSRNNLKDVKIWAKYILAGLLFLLPFALTNLYFYLGDHFKEFCYITYELPKHYGNDPTLSRYFIMLLDLIAKFLPISFIVFYVLFKKGKPWQPKDKWFFAFWICFVLISMYVPGKEFSHYTIQLMLPLSIVAGLFFHPEFKKGRIVGTVFSKKYGFVTLVVLIVGIQFSGILNEIVKPDYEREVADYIAEHKKEGDEVFITTYHQIVYYLLEEECPTKYVHFNNLFTDNSDAFQVSPSEEVKRIFNTNPRFVVFRGKNSLIENQVEKRDYALVKTFNHDKIKIYELERRL